MTEKIPSDAVQNVLAVCEKVSAHEANVRNTALLLGGVAAVAGANMIKHGFAKSGSAVVVASSLATTGIASHAHGTLRHMQAIADDFGAKPTHGNTWF